MSPIGRGTPGPFQPAVAQRDIELEVAKCVGGVTSPLLFNIAMSVLDEHLHGPWEQTSGQMGTTSRRVRRRRKGLPNWRLVRYADDLAVLTDGHRGDVEDLREDIVRVLEPLGLQLSAAKTRIVHMSEGFDFLGFHIRCRRKRGSTKWYVYTFIADRPCGCRELDHLI